MQLNNYFQQINLVRAIGFVLIIAAILIGVLGFINQNSGQFMPALWIKDFYANLSAELASIAFTILIIDYFTERREKRNLKAQLFRELQTRDNGFAQRTMREIMANGWHEDGSLHGQFLNYCNLENVYLRNTDFTDCRLHQASFRSAWMRGVCLKGANLTGSDFTGARRLTPRQLLEANKLVGSKMPDGHQYDGRFNLPGDFELAIRDGHDIKDSRSMAAFYRVPLAKFQYWQDNQMMLDTDWEKLIEEEAKTKLRPYFNTNSIALTSSQNFGQKNLRQTVGLSVISMGIGFLIKHWFFEKNKPLET